MAAGPSFHAGLRTATLPAVTSHFVVHLGALPAATGPGGASALAEASGATQAPASRVTPSTAIIVMNLFIFEEPTRHRYVTA
ncbi:hypothetical protein [Streptomyces sp. NPDC002276]